MTLVAMARLAAATCFLFFSTQAASINDDQETCIAAAEQAGVDFDSFKYNVGHMIHSLTVEDVRFFFDEAFPVDNDIPTVNTNLTGPPVLPHTPSFPSKFKFPLGSTLDRILLNNDDKSSYSIKDWTSLDELAHAAHMYEMLFSASKIYKLLEDVAVHAICPCLVDEESNGVLDELNYLAEVFRFDNSKPLEEQTVKIDEKCTQKNNKRQGRARQGFKKYTATFTYEKEAKIESSLSLDQFPQPANFSSLEKLVPPTNFSVLQPFNLTNLQEPIRKGRAINICPDVADIEDSTTWKNWQHDIGGPLDDEAAIQMSKNVALYLYCKISQ